MNKRTSGKAIMEAPKHETCGTYARVIRSLLDRAAEHLSTTVRIGVGEKVRVAQLKPIHATRRECRSGCRSTAFRTNSHARADPPLLVVGPRTGETSQRHQGRASWGYSASV